MRRRFDVAALLLVCASCAGPGWAWRPDLDDFDGLEGAGPAVDRGGHPRYWIELGSVELSEHAPKFEVKRELRGLPKGKYTVALESPNDESGPELRELLDVRIEVLSPSTRDVPAQDWTARTSAGRDGDLLACGGASSEYSYLLDTASMEIESGRCSIEVRGVLRMPLAAPRVVRVYLAGGGVFY